MVSLEFIPLKTIDGKTVGHARVKDGVADLTLKRPMRGQVIVLSDNASAAGSIGAPIAIAGQISAVAVHDGGTLLCYGAARNAAITAEDIRRRLLTFRAAQQELSLRVPPPENRVIPTNSVRNEPPPWQPTVEYLHPGGRLPERAAASVAPRTGASTSTGAPPPPARDPVTTAERALFDRAVAETAAPLTPQQPIADAAAPPEPSFLEAPEKKASTTVPQGEHSTAEQERQVFKAETLRAAVKHKRDFSQLHPPLPEYPPSVDTAYAAQTLPTVQKAPPEPLGATASDTEFSVLNAPLPVGKTPTVADTAADAASFAALLKRADAVFAEVQREKPDEPELSTLAESLPRRDERRQERAAADPPAQQTETASRAVWNHAVDTLLETPVSTAKTPVQNPFPHIFPGAHFVRLIADDGSPYLEGDCMQGRERVRILAVPGNYSPQTPAHLPGFTRFIRTRMGGFWVKVE